MAEAWSGLALRPLSARVRAAQLSKVKVSSINDFTTERDFTQTTTSYAIGVETVLNNMVFDLAWMFGGEPASASITICCSNPSEPV